jgi:hypothetical protein
MSVGQTPDVKCICIPINTRRTLFKSRTFDVNVMGVGRVYSGQRPSDFLCRFRRTASHRFCTTQYVAGVGYPSDVRLTKKTSYRRTPVSTHPPTDVLALVESPGPGLSRSELPFEVENFRNHAQKCPKMPKNAQKCLDV